MTVPRLPRDRSGWWQLALAALVAPFYIGLFLITLIGGAVDRRRGDHR